MGPMSDFYDLDAANDRIGELRPLLEQLRNDRDIVAETQQRLERLRESASNGSRSSELDERRQQMGTTIKRMEAAVRQIDGWSIALRDISTGLVDFPALVNGRPVWLCWKLGEDDVAWWHDLDTGIAGRRPLIEME
jgi:hypothetical protein